MGFMLTGSSASRMLNFAARGSFWKLEYDEENFACTGACRCPWYGDGRDGVMLRRLAGSGAHECPGCTGNPVNPGTPAPPGATGMVGAGGSTRGG